MFPQRKYGSSTLVRFLLPHMLMDSNKERNEKFGVLYIASCMARLYVTYSAFIVDKGMQSGFLLHHDIAFPPRVKTKNEFNLDLPVSPP